MREGSRPHVPAPCTTAGGQEIRRNRIPAETISCRDRFTILTGISVGTDFRETFFSSERELLPFCWKDHALVPCSTAVGAGISGGTEFSRFACEVMSRMPQTPPSPHPTGGGNEFLHFSGHFYEQGDAKPSGKRNTSVTRNTGGTFGVMCRNTQKPKTFPNDESAALAVEPNGGDHDGTLWIFLHRASFPAFAVPLQHPLGKPETARIRIAKRKPHTALFRAVGRSFDLPLCALLFRSELARLLRMGLAAGCRRSADAPVRALVGAVFPQ